MSGISAPRRGVRYILFAMVAVALLQCSPADVAVERSEAPTADDLADPRSTLHVDPGPGRSEPAAGSSRTPSTGSEPLESVVGQAAVATTSTATSLAAEAPKSRGSFEDRTGVVKVDLDTGPYPNDSIRIWYRAPEVDLAQARILVVVPGRRRNAEEYRDAWKDEVDNAGVLLLVPELPDGRYSSAEYNRGNLVDDAGDDVSPDQWTFNIVESLFDWARAEVDGDQPGYYLYGHSAGAQFVHRFMLFMAEHRVLHAVSANAGWYTTPEIDIPFPYGLGESPASVEIEAALATRLTVMVGAEDDEAEADGLRTTPEAELQGLTRLERGLHFYAVAQEVARRLGVQLGWDIQIVAGVGHSNADIAPAAAVALFDR